MEHKVINLEVGIKGCKVCVANRPKTLCLNGHGPLRFNFKSCQYVTVGTFVTVGQHWLSGEAVFDDKYYTGHLLKRFCLDLRQDIVFKCF